MSPPSLDRADVAECGIDAGRDFRRACRATGRAGEVPTSCHTVFCAALRSVLRATLMPDEGGITQVGAA